MKLSNATTHTAETMLDAFWGISNDPIRAKNFAYMLKSSIDSTTCR